MAFDEGPSYCTPVGSLVWPHLNTPRQFQGQGKFSYDTNIDFEGKAGEEVVSFLRKYAQDFGQRRGSKISLSSIIQEATAKDDDGKIIELPGVTRIKFKVSNIETRNGLWDRKPAFVNVNGEPFVPEPMIGGGTTAQIIFTVYEWPPPTKAGMTLQPKVIKIHNLCEYRQKSETDTVAEALSIGGDYGGSSSHPADF